MAKETLGIFQYEEDFLDAVRNLSEAGYRDITVMSPIPVHEVEHLLQTKKPVIRRYSLGGALLGMVTGFTLAAGTAMVFILPTGGRPIITFPPYLVISYELTILFGVIATLIGFHVASGLPAWHDKPYRRSTNIDRFSVLVGGEDDSALSRAEQIMNDAGAEEVTRELYE